MGTFAPVCPCRLLHDFFPLPWISTLATEKLHIFAELSASAFDVNSSANSEVSRYESCSEQHGSNLFLCVRLCCIFKFIGCCVHLISCLGRSDLRGLTQTGSDSVWKQIRQSGVVLLGSSDAATDQNGGDWLSCARRSCFMDAVCGNWVIGLHCSTLPPAVSTGTAVFGRYSKASRIHAEIRGVDHERASNSSSWLLLYCCINSKTSCSIFSL